MLTHDMRHAFRLLLRRPLLTISAILTLALGVGANTAIFSVVNAVLLSPLPYPDPHRLVQIWTRFTGVGLTNDENNVSPPEVRDLTTLNRSLSHVAAYDVFGFNLSGKGHPERIEGALVSPAVFPMLDVRPLLGRMFVADDADPGRENVALLSHGLWQRRFGADRTVIGRAVRLNGWPFVIVGVLPPDFRFPGETESELLVPLAFSAKDLETRGDHWLRVVARLRPGVSLEQARADMQAVAERMIEQNPGYPYRKYNFGIIVKPLAEEMVGDVRGTLWLLMGAVTLVLLIACTNVANLLLVQASTRGSELAIRLALGANRRRLVAQLITESILLAGFGGLAGLLLGHWGTTALARLAAGELPRVGGVAMDGRVLVFTAMITVATGLFFGIAPALQASRTAGFERLRHGAQRSTSERSVRRLQYGLIIGQVALSLTLLVGAGLLIRSFVKVLDVDPGFRPEGVLTMRVTLTGPQYATPERVRAFLREALERVRRLPGVEAAGAVSGLPLSGDESSGTITADTQSVPANQVSPDADLRAVVPGYFEAMGIELLRGRYFEARDDEEQGAPVAIVDERLAATLWPGQDPLGKRLKRGFVDSPRAWMTIVGVVGHVRYRTLESPSRIQVYYPHAHSPSTSLSLVIRAAGDPRTIINAVRQQVLDIDREQPVYRIRTMNELMAAALARRRLVLVLIGLLSGVALLLAAVGIYSVIAYSVSQRMHEFGVRIALGASGAGILGLVIRRGMALAALGCLLGVITSLALRDAVRSLLYAVDPSDPITVAGVLVLLLSIALVACYLPARRATRVDPATVLRSE
jgi:putative ABC transport system permease protein